MNRGATRPMTLVGLAFFFWAVMSCGDEVPESAQTIDPGRVLYTLTWDWGDTYADPETGARHFETNLGYHVVIEEGYVSSATLEMVPCAPEQASSWRKWYSPGIAWAEHSYNVDASKVSGTLVEDMLSDEGLFFGEGESSGAVYCQVHLLYAPLEVVDRGGDARGNLTLYLRGSVRAPGAEKATPLEVSTSLRSGAVLDVESLAFQEGEVRVLRHPSRAFEGVELDTLTSEEIAYEFLKGLGAGSAVEVVPRVSS